MVHFTVLLMPMTTVMVLGSNGFEAPYSIPTLTVEPPLLAPQTEAAVVPDWVEEVEDFDVVEDFEEVEDVLDVEVLLVVVWVVEVEDVEYSLVVERMDDVLDVAIVWLVERDDVVVAPVGLPPWTT